VETEAEERIKRILAAGGVIAGKTSDLTDHEMSLLRAGRVAPERDYDYADD
jgi:hypothetical protein